MFDDIYIYNIKKLCIDGKTRFWGRSLRSSCDLFFTAKNSWLTILPQLLFWLRNVVTLITLKLLVCFSGLANCTIYNLYVIKFSRGGQGGGRGGGSLCPPVLLLIQIKNDSHDIGKILLNAMFKKWLPLK